MKILNKGTVIFFACILFNQTVLAQDLNSTSKYNKLLDSTLTAFESDANLKKSHYKSFMRWYFLSKNRAGIEGMADYFTERSKSTRESPSMTALKGTPEIVWNYFGPTDIPGTPGNGINGQTGKGWIFNIDVDETDNDIIYAGSHNSGIWKTEDHGNSWDPLTDEYSEILGIRSLAVKGDTIIVSSSLGEGWYAYSNGLFRSTDGGENWESINNGALSMYPTTMSTNFYNIPRKLMYNPYNSDELLYITYNGVYKSSDYGNDWDTVANYSFDGDSWQYGFYDCEVITPSGGSQLIFLSGSKVYKYNGSSSIDISDTVFAAAGYSNTSSVKRCIIASDTAYPDNLWYLILNDHNLDTNDSIKLVKYDFQNDSYTLLYERSVSDDDKLVCEVSPNDTSTVYLGWLQMWKYDENTDVLENISHSTLSSDSDKYGPDDWIHDDIRDFQVIDNGSRDKLYMGHDGGVSWGEYDVTTSDFEFYNISDDGTDGLYVTEFYGMGVYDGNDILVNGGTQDLSSFVYGAPGYDTTWIHCMRGDGGDAIINYNDPDSMYFVSYLANTVYCSANGGRDYYTAVTGNDLSPFSQIKLDPVHSDKLYVAKKGAIRRYNRINDDKSDYDDLTLPCGDSSFIDVFDIPECDTNTIYAARDIIRGTSGPFSHIMWKSTNGGSSWTSISQNFGDTAFNYQSITDIEVNPDDANEVWVCFGNATHDYKKVFKTTDGGSSWTVLDKNYPSPNLPCHKILYDKTSGILYLGTDAGIFRYNEVYGWEDISYGLPKKYITDIGLNRTSSKLFASTFGRGIWVADIPENYCYDADELEVTTSQTWSNDTTICSDILINNGAELTLTGNITVSPVAVIRVIYGTLKVQGELTCGRLIIFDSSRRPTNLEISDSGEVILVNKFLHVQEGAKLNIPSNGYIGISNE